MDPYSHCPRQISSIILIEYQLLSIMLKQVGSKQAPLAQHADIFPDVTRGLRPYQSQVNLPDGEMSWTGQAQK